MDNIAKRELAVAIVRVHRCREASYVSGRYRLSYDECATRVCLDHDLQPLVVAMLVSGYADFLEWAVRLSGMSASVVTIDA